MANRDKNLESYRKKLDQVIKEIVGAGYRLDARPPFSEGQRQFAGGLLIVCGESKEVKHVTIPAVEG